MGPFSPKPIDDLSGKKEIFKMDMLMILFGIFVLGGIAGFFYSNHIFRQSFEAKCFMTREYMLNELNRIGFNGTQSMEMCIKFAGQNGGKK